MNRHLQCTHILRKQLQELKLPSDLKKSLHEIVNTIAIKVDVIVYNNANFDNDLGLMVKAQFYSK